MLKSKVSKSKIPTDIEEILNDFTTTSSKIRYLNSIGYTRSQIALKLNKRYQHVRNVLITPLTSNKI